MTICRKPYTKKTLNNSSFSMSTPMVSPYSQRVQYSRSESPYTEFCLNDGVFLKINNSFFLTIGNGFKLKLN